MQASHSNSPVTLLEQAHKNGQPVNNAQEVATAAKAWAEFLYNEYCLEKSLHKEADSNTIGNATNHDKLNT